MKSLVYAPDAIADLADITDYIGIDNPERALTFVTELEAKAAQAAERPQSFPARDDIAPGIRLAVHGNYRILFREEATEVRIVHVVHAKRDLRRLTFD